MTGERCVAAHYAHDCSDPKQCRMLLALMLANVERREQRAELDRQEQARAAVLAVRDRRVA